MLDNSFRTLLEKIKAETEIYQIDLPVKESQISDVFSKKTIDLHYGILYKNYVKKALDGGGDFQIAGAKLHTLFFEQFQSAKSPNNPTGDIKKLIDQEFKNYHSFKNSFADTALEIQGSGWAYLNKNGKIKTISNHKNVDDIVVIIDMWEHSYIFDYGSDKQAYLMQVWKLINWDIINKRLN